MIVWTFTGEGTHHAWHDRSSWHTEPHPAARRAADAPAGGAGAATRCRSPSARSTPSGRCRARPSRTGTRSTRSSTSPAAPARTSSTSRAGPAPAAPRRHRAGPGAPLGRRAGPDRPRRAVHRRLPARPPGRPGPAAAAERAAVADPRRARPRRVTRLIADLDDEFRDGGDSVRAAGPAARPGRACRLDWRHVPSHRAPGGGRGVRPARRPRRPRAVVGARLAARIGVTPGHLTEAVKAATGRTAAQLLREAEARRPSGSCPDGPHGAPGRAPCRVRRPRLLLPVLPPRDRAEPRRFPPLTAIRRITTTDRSSPSPRATVAYVRETWTRSSSTARRCCVPRSPRASPRRSLRRLRPHRPGSLELTPSCDDGDDPTPPQTEGPYFKPNSPQRTSLVTSGTPGTRLTVTGYVFGLACQPLAGVLMDFWQADVNGALRQRRLRLPRPPVHLRPGRVHAEHDRARPLSRAYPAHPREGPGTRAARAHHAAVLPGRAAQQHRPDLRPAPGDDRAAATRPCSTSC